MLLRQQRHMLNYMRLIEHDMPNLVRWREPFTPPTSDRPLVVRTINYGGEEHPATAKRTVVVAVAHLPLDGSKARHTFKLLAGPRWSPSPPPDSGIGPSEGKDEDGFIKISCEDFPQPGMNLKWISDVLDRLVAEANANSKKFGNVPLDTRHIESKKRKAKKGEIRGMPRPTIQDFPRAWLPGPASA
ncbi:ribosomal protein S24/S35, mitochondrial, conserved domain-containing protein [Phellopilus nigrolimitatus]|nr:ribosomal protein S24/S35, mitochondrial, conserved domain-containing protein [Phellopilus nigrolimitatus]